MGPDGSPAGGGATARAGASPRRRISALAGLFPKRQSAGAPGQRRGGGGRATCPNCLNDNQPQRRRWRRATVWGVGGGGTAFHAVASPRLVVRLYWSGGRRRRCTGVADRLGRVEGHALPGPGGSGLCACWTTWRGTGSGPPQRECWGTRQDPSVGVEPTGSTPCLYYNLPG